MTGAQLLVGYSDVFGNNGPDVRTEIGKLHMHKSISIICELIALKDARLEPVRMFGLDCYLPYEMVLKNELLGIACDTPEEMAENPLLKANVRILSTQMLLILLKKILAYGNYDTLHGDDYEITLEDYKKIVALQLCVVDEVNENQERDLDPNHFLYATYHLNYQRNLANEFLRMYYMMECLSKDRNHFDADVQGQYRDYYTAFTQKYGVTPTEYSSLLFGELQIYYAKRSGLSGRSMWRNPYDFYENIAAKDKIAKIIHTISQTADEYQAWAIETETREWDFSKFYDYPYIHDSHGKYISISDVTLRNAFFEKLFWLIRWCYPIEDSRAMAFFGRLFEKYIQVLTEEAGKQTEYAFIPEFEYAVNKKSSDAYIRKNAHMLAVEAKGFSVLLNCMIKNESVEQNMQKLFIDPVLQADRCLARVLDKDDRFLDVDDVYIISVTMDNINAVPAYYSEIHKQIEAKKKCAKTKYYFNLSIEEYEMLMFLMEKGYDIFALLREHFENSVLKPFGNFLQEKCPDIGMTDFMETVYKEASDTMKNILFPGQSE